MASPWDRQMGGSDFKGSRAADILCMYAHPLDWGPSTGHPSSAFPPLVAVRTAQCHLKVLVFLCRSLMPGRLTGHSFSEFPPMFSAIRLVRLTAIASVHGSRHGAKSQEPSRDPSSIVLGTRFLVVSGTCETVVASSSK